MATGGRLLEVAVMLTLAAAVLPGAVVARADAVWAQAVAEGWVVVPQQGRLEVVDALDPTVRRVVLDEHSVLADLLDDGRSAAVVTSRGVEVVDLDTGSRWTAREGATSAAWSPDGRHLAVGREGVVELVDVVSGSARPLLNARQITVPGQCGPREAGDVTVEGWAQSGGTVLVVGHDRGCDEYAHSALVAVDVAASAHVPLTGGDVTLWTPWTSTPRPTASSSPPR